MSSEARDARKLTTRLVTLAATESDASGSAALAAHAACERTCRALARSVGPAGAHALLSRALTRAQAQHPILKSFHVGSQLKPGLGPMPANFESNDAKAAAAGLEAVLENMLGLLGRLVGDDMVAQLVDQRSTRETQDDGDVK